MKILVLGDAILDHYVYGAVYRQSPEDPAIPVVDFVEEEYKLGGCLNVAANIRSLAHKLKDEVYVSSIISDFTAEQLKKKNVFHDQVVLNVKDVPHVRELIKTRIVHSETHKQFLRLDNRLKFSSGDIARYKNKCSFYSGKDFDAIVVSDYNKGLIDDFIIQKLNEVDCHVFVDTKKSDLSLWKNLKRGIIKINEKEFEQAKNINDCNCHLVVTKGKDGCMVVVKDEVPYFGHSQIYSPHWHTIPVKDANVIGAGDVFLAGLVVKYMETSDIDLAAQYANKAAGVAVKKFKTSEVRRDEIV